MDYPTLINTVPFTISAYSLESVIAEKFEAMITLDQRNSRLKDFYDINSILYYHKIDPKTLKEAIKLTFLRRQTVLPEAPAIFQNTFGIDPRNLLLWKAFLNRIKADPLDFKLILDNIKEHLQPIYEELRNKLNTQH